MVEWCCPKCGSNNIRWMTTVMVSDTMDSYEKLSKKSFRKSSLVLWNVNWDQRTLVCADCQTLLSEGWRPVGMLPPEFKHFCSCCDGRGYIHKKVSDT